MKIIKVARRFLAVVLTFVLLPFAYGIFLLTLLFGICLALIEEMGLDTGIVGDTFIKFADKWPEAFKKIVLKTAGE